MLRKLLEGFPFLHDTISLVVTQRYHLTLDDLPPHEDEKACATYEAKLCRDYIASKLTYEPAFANGGEEAPQVNQQEADEGEAELEAVEVEIPDETEPRGEDAPELVRHCHWLVCPSAHHATYRVISVKIH